MSRSRRTTGPCSILPASRSPASTKSWAARRTANGIRPFYSGQTAVVALFVTVDPERDTPDVLKAYLKNFDPRIIGLTGDPSKTAAIAKAFRAYATKKVTGEGVVYLMDKRGKFVSTFNLERPPAEAARELEAYL